MIEQVTSLINNFQELMKANQVVAGAFSLWGLGVLTFIVRNVPTKILNFIKTQATSTLTINSQDYIYYDILRWIADVGLHRFTRTFNVNNNRFGSGGHWNGELYEYEKIFSLGYGVHWVFWNKNLLWFSREIESANQSEYTKERINITILGRSQKSIHKLLKDVAEYMKEFKKPNELNVYCNHDRGWIPLSTVSKRPLDSVIIERDKKQIILNEISNFISTKAWYIERGIPYHLGILLKGPPGTGKSSLIKGLCSYFDRHLYLLNLKGMTDDSLLKILSEVPENSVVVIEDIDACDVSLSRKEKEKMPPKILSSLTISGLLNALDGITSAENRILIATTNHPEKLDSALLRPGRIDLEIEIGYMTRDSLEEYLCRFYKNFKLDPHLILRDEIAPCVVQQLVLTNKEDPKKVIEALTVKREHVALEEIGMTKTQKRLLRKICRYFNVRYRTIPADGTGCEGYVCHEKEMIEIVNTRQSIDSLISIVLHEICHILASRDNKFPLYHYKGATALLSKKHIRAVIQTGWRAERYIDSQAAKWMALLFPDRQYKKAYKDSDKEWYNKHHLSFYKEILTKGENK